MTFPEQSIRILSEREVDCLSMLERGGPLTVIERENSVSVDTVLIVGDSFLASGRTFTSARDIPGKLVMSRHKTITAG